MPICLYAYMPICLYAYMQIQFDIVCVKYSVNYSIVCVLYIQPGAYNCVGGKTS